MSLSAREQQALDSIEDRLAHSDPKLAALLATFTRLTSSELMPVREKILAAWPQVTRCLRDTQRRWYLNARCWQARRTGHRPGWQRTMLLLWLLVSIALIMVALSVSRGSGLPRFRARSTPAPGRVDERPGTAAPAVIVARVRLAALPGACHPLPGRTAVHRGGWSGAGRRCPGRSEERPGGGEPR